MPNEAFQVLGQAAPAANTLTALYTVPAATQVVASCLVVCNQNAASIRFRVSVAIAGAADMPAQYLYYDGVLPANNSLTVVIGIALAATDVVRVQTNTANVSFSLLGDQVTGLTGESLQNLGQAAPAATTLTALYTVPTTQAAVSALVVCNQNAVTIQFRVSIAPGGAADTPSQYIYYDSRLPANSSLVVVLGMTLHNTDVVRVYTNTAGVSFNLFGDQIT